MKTVEYVSDYNKNYLKIGIEECKSKKLRYQYQIFLNRKLEGFLPVVLNFSDGCSSLYYDISSKQSFDKWFIKKKIDRGFIAQFVSDLKVALWSMEQYLLDERNLVLRPDTVFRDMESGKMLFLYYPYFVETEQGGADEFLLFLIEHIEQGEEDMTEAVYSLYSQWESMGELFTPGLLLSFLERLLRETDPKEAAEEKPSLREEEEGSIPREERSRRDIKGFFSNFYRGPAKEKPAAMTIKQWGYKTEKEEEKPAAERTAYMAVSMQKEERKLYGNGRENRRVICLEKLPVVIGKKDGIADVILSDGSVSRMHARISEEEGHIFLEDLNATNGTYKNSVRLQPYEKVELLKEDEIKLGNLSFTYR